MAAGSPLTISLASQTCCDRQAVVTERTTSRVALPKKVGSER